MLEHMKDKISNDESFVPAGIFAAMEKVTEGEAALQAKDAEIEARDAALQQVEQEKAQMEDEKAQMEDKMRERESSLKKQMAEEKQQMQQQLLGDCAGVTQALIDTIGLYSNRNGFYHRVFYCKTTNLPRPQSDQYGKQRKMANAFANRDTYRPSEDTRLQAACGNGGAAPQTTGRFCRCAARALRAGWDRGQAAHSSCIRGESHIHPQREAEHVGVACRAACDWDGVRFR